MSINIVIHHNLHFKPAYDGPWRLPQCTLCMVMRMMTIMDDLWYTPVNALIMIWIVECDNIKTSEVIQTLIINQSNWWQIEPMQVGFYGCVLSVANRVRVADVGLRSILCMQLISINLGSNMFRFQIPRVIVQFQLVFSWFLLSVA